MLSSKISLSNIIKQGRSPARVFTEFNDEVCANNPEEMFITAWVGILNLETGILTTACRKLRTDKKDGDRPGIRKE